MRTRLLPEAERDLADAYGWYKEQQQGLEAEFRRSIDASLAAIERYPEAFPVVHRDVRRVLLRRFPYAVFFLSLPAEVVVLALFHVARDPNSWKRRGRTDP